MGYMVVLNRLWWPIFSKSWVLWFTRSILNRSAHFFQMNSRLWKKLPIIRLPPGLRILSISENTLSILWICSKTKKLNARSKLWSWNGSVSSRLQIIFFMFPECFASNFSEISQAVYEWNSIFLCWRSLYVLQSPAPKSIMSRFLVSLGRSDKKNHLSKLFKWSWYCLYSLAIRL